MAAKSKGGRHRLDADLAADLADFCSAHYRAPEKEIISAALREFIDRQLLLEPELRKRFDTARASRIGASSKVTLIKGGKE